MRRDSMITTSLVLGAMVVAGILHGLVIGSSREAVRLWVVAIEGVVTAGGVLAIWYFARVRRTAVIGLAAAAVVVMLGGAGLVDLAGWLIASSLGWAVLVTLVIRLLLPESAEVSGRAPAHHG